MTFDSPTGHWSHVTRHFFFFPPGITLATALAIDPATFATTLFFEPRFFAFGLLVLAEDFDLVLLAFGADLDFDLVFFFLAVLAITDCSIPRAVPILLNFRSIPRSPNEPL